jgi:hypothetical protein
MGGPLRAGQSIMVHRLVALAFLPLPAGGDKAVVNHKNGIKTDNRPCNLEWTTYRKNSIHSRTTLGHRGRSMTIPEVVAIIERASGGERVKDIAEELNLSRQCVSRIINGRMWRSKDYPMIGAARKKNPYVSPKHGTKHMVKD